MSTKENLRIAAGFFSHESYSFEDTNINTVEYQSQITWRLAYPPSDRGENSILLAKSVEKIGKLKAHTGG